MINEQLDLYTSSIVRFDSVHSKLHETGVVLALKVAQMLQREIAERLMAAIFDKQSHPAHESYDETLQRFQIVERS